MEIKKEDFELFMQFKKFMSEMGDTPTSSSHSYKPRRERGTGSIITLSGKRKRRYLASITTGYDIFTGKQTQTPLAYFIEPEHAQKALDIYLLEKSGKCAKGTCLEYIYTVDGKPSKKSNLIDINLNVNVFNNTIEVKTCPTFKEIWDKVYLNDLNHLSDRALTNYKVSFRHFEDLHNKKIDSITLKDLQPYFDELMSKGTGQSKMNNMKIVLNYIFKYAIKYDYIEKNYVQYIKFKDTLEDKKTKVPFTKEQIKELFKHDDDLIVQSILIMIYTGMRPSELLELKEENIHIEERYMIGGIKTKNGIDRVIPIHECIVEYMRSFKANPLGISYQKYLRYFHDIQKQYNFNCTPHSCRHTFATLCNEYGLNEFLVKKIIGHSAKDLTKDVYTHVDTQRLIEEVNKMPSLND